MSDPELPQDEPTDADDPATGEPPAEDSAAGPIEDGGIPADHNPEFSDESDSAAEEAPETVEPAEENAVTERAAEMDGSADETPEEHHSEAVHGSETADDSEPVAGSDDNSEETAEGTPGEGAPEADATPEGDGSESKSEGDGDEEGNDEVYVPEAQITSTADLEQAEEPEDVDELKEQMQWFVLKVISNREQSVKDNIEWRIKREDLEDFFGQIVIPVEKIKEKTKTGKTRIRKQKLFPGYMMIQMVLNEDTWYLVRDTNGVGDFTGSAGKPIPMEEHEVQRMLGHPEEPVEGGEEPQPKTVDHNIPFSMGDAVKINDGSFVGFEGVVIDTDPATGKIKVEVTILGQPTPVELEYYQVELT